MVARRQPPLPQDHGRRLSRGAEKPRGLLRHLQRRSRARFADARRRGRSRRARGQAHDCARAPLYRLRAAGPADQDRKSTRLNSSHSQISYAVFCLKKKKKKKKKHKNTKKKEKKTSK